MRSSQKPWLLVGALALLCILPGAFGQTTVGMKLTGVNGNSYDGVYTSPYTAQVGGVSTTVICDDFATESYVGETWQATVTNVASVVAGTSKAKFSPAQSYDAIAYLATELVNVDPASQQAVILSYAIWDIFDPSGVSAWFTQHGDPASIAGTVFSDATGALNGQYSAGAYSNVTIYTSTLGAPQEFISVQPPVQTPEPASAAVLGVDLLTALAGIYLLRRYRPRSIS
jgi:hypothetical protein